MLYGLQDVARLRQMVDEGDASDEKKRLDHRKLDSLLGFCETTRCRRQVLLEYFNDTCAPCGNCDTCLEPVASFDGTELARKALSCVYRTGQLFGAAHLIDVLTGRVTDKVAKFGHDRLSTYGIGKELSPIEWRSVFRQLVAAGHIRVDVEGHGSLKLTESSRPLLRGETLLMLRQESATARKLAKPAKPAPPMEQPADETLFQALRHLRTELAREQGLPPYMIFGDVSLKQMAARRPTTLDQFALISGVGAAKLQRYGALFLKVLTEDR